MSSIAIFANPIAGRGRGHLVAERVGRLLRGEGYEVRLVTARAEEVDIGALLAGEVAAVVTIGGDGTLRAVAARLMEFAKDQPATVEGWAPIPPLLMVPMGTANLMGRHLGIADDELLEERVRAALRRREIHGLDAATANGQLFLLMAGIGIDAAIVHEVDRARSGPISMLSYVLPAALSLHAYQATALEVRADGKLIFPMAPALAFVGNVKEYGTGFAMLPAARPDDDLLDVCVLPAKTSGEVVQHFLHAATGQHLHGEGVRYVKARRVEITSTAPIPMQLDGEAAGFTPVEIKLLPRRLPFLVIGQ